MGRRALDELAAEYVQIVYAPDNPAGKITDRAWDLQQEIYRRVGREHGDTYIDQARKVYALLVPQ